MVWTFYFQQCRRPSSLTRYTLLTTVASLWVAHKDILAHVSQTHAQCLLALAWHDKSRAIGRRDYSREGRQLTLALSRARYNAESAQSIQAHDLHGIEN